MIRSSNATIFTKFDQGIEEEDLRELNRKFEQILMKTLEDTAKAEKSIRFKTFTESFKKNAKRYSAIAIIQENPIYFIDHFTKTLDRLKLAKDSPLTALKNEILSSNEFNSLGSESILPEKIEYKKESAVQKEKASDFWKKNIEKSENLLEELSQKIGWRFFVDGVKQRDETPTSYDSREPGCLVAMASAFRKTIGEIEKPLTFNEIISIHDECVSKVRDLNEEQQEHGEETYRKGEEIVGFGIGDLGDKPNMTTNGFRELCLHEGADKDYTLRCKRVLGILYGDPLKKRVEAIISNYNEKMKKSTQPGEKLAQIISMVSLLERIHPFYDANCRTLCVIVLNRELFKHGFPPAILDDPNRFDAFSQEELMGEVIKGFENYEHVKAKGLFPQEQSRKFKKEDEALMEEINSELSRSLTKRRKLV